MVLIISQHGDASTNNVIDWIHYYDKKFMRINREEVFFEARPDFRIEIASDFEEFYVIDKGSSEVSTYEAVWFRHSIYAYLPKNIFNEIENKNLLIRLRESFYYEYQISNLIFYSYLEKKKRVLGNFQKWMLNKIDILNTAKSSGIDIPATLITNKKTDVQAFLEKKGHIITKALSEVTNIIVESDNEVAIYLNYTEEITKESIGALPDKFSYSLFQEKIDKDIEIRIFYIVGDVYSMAIFSQLDKQTSVDFRKYSNNRNVPYRIPDELKAKICNLMNHIGLDTGSIDLILTKDGRYVFLEVNPTGQYGMTSNPCNYYLDKIIAEYLINKD